MGLSDALCTSIDSALHEGYRCCAHFVDLRNLQIAQRNLATDGIRDESIWEIPIGPTGIAWK